MDHRNDQRPAKKKTGTPKPCRERREKGYPLREPPQQRPPKPKPKSGE